MGIFRDVRKEQFGRHRRAPCTSVPRCFAPLHSIEAHAYPGVALHSFEGGHMVANPPHGLTLAVVGPLSHIACGWYGLPNSQGVGCFHDCRSCFVRPQGANDLHDCRFRLGPQGPTTSCRSSPFETTRANDVKPFFVGRGHSATGPTTFVFALKHPCRQVYLDVALHSHWGRVYTL